MMLHPLKSRMTLRIPHWRLGGSGGPSQQRRRGVLPRFARANPHARHWRARYLAQKLEGAQQGASTSAKHPFQNIESWPIRFQNLNSKLPDYGKLFLKDAIAARCMRRSGRQRKSALRPQGTYRINRESWREGRTKAWRQPFEFCVI